MGIGEQFEFEKTGRIDREPKIGQVIDELRFLARKKALYDNEDFMVDDYAGGNIDDAYYRGVDDGEISLARKVLGQLEISYKGE